jgi:uncharacterized protein YndB with AHSA1/START domain
MSCVQPKIKLSKLTGMKNSILLLAIFCLLAYWGNAEQTMTHNNKRRNHMIDTSKKYDVVVTRVFDAPVEQVWKAWSESEQVMRWWGPTGFTSPMVKMDFRVGGRSLVCMRAPKEFGGQDMFNTWTYQKIDSLERIEFILNFSDKDGNKLNPAKIGLPPGIPEDVPHVIIFRKLGENKTEMTVTEYGYASQETVNMSKSGLEQCLDKMAASFKN